MYLPVGGINKKFLQVKVRKRRKTRSFTLFSRFFCHQGPLVQSFHVKMIGLNLIRKN